MSDRFPCPCCGHRVLGTFGFYEICPICRWEDDVSQLRWVTSLGQNGTSLVQAQRNYMEFGVSDEKWRSHSRRPFLDEHIDPAWRPVDLRRDSFEDPSDTSVPPAPWPEDQLTLCWWLPTFWRRVSLLPPG
ncbi:CPCC family cysteine-rich protein [Streptomyces sp. NPDC088725]|uniref:CPCC family cysteine-rich protein n=1 Tax=Streptomyces sp. NPDC088725 TaxID=3365873 RepID=UPI00381E510B